MKKRLDARRGEALGLCALNIFLIPYCAGDVAHTHQYCLGVLGYSSC